MGWKFALELVLLISLTLSNSSEARNVKNLHSSAVIFGRVLCNTCFKDDFSRSSHFISGATVSVECKDAGLRTEGETNEQGEFKVHLPLPISKHQEEIKGCQVRLIKSNDPYCAVASAATSSPIHLKSRKQGTRVFSAGLFTFKPLKQPDLCNQQPGTKPSNKVNAQMGLLDPTEPKDPPKAVTAFKESIARPQLLFPPVVPGVPAVPGLPILPVVPGVPAVPGLPTLPVVPGVPAVPGLPIPPVVPAVPRLPIPPGVPSLPLPPGLPIPPVVPGVPPAKKVSP